MCNDHQKFTKLTDTKQSKIITAANQYINSSSTGEINLQVMNYGRRNDVKLKKRYVCPKTKK